MYGRGLFLLKPYTTQEYTENIIITWGKRNISWVNQIVTLVLYETHWCRKSDTYDSTWGAISDTFDDSTRQFCSFFCRISAVFTVIRKKITDHLPIANWNTYSQHIHFLQIWYVIEVFRFIRKNIHFCYFISFTLRVFLNITLRGVRMMIFSINRGFENDQILTS